MDTRRVGTPLVPDLMVAVLAATTQGRSPVAPGATGPRVWASTVRS